MQLYLPPVEAFPEATRLYRHWGERVKCGKRDRLYCLRQGEQTLGMARVLEPDSGVFLLRNLTVAPERRGQSLGRELMRRLLADRSVQPLHCYALGHLQRFYESLGFQCLPLDSVPDAIAEPFARYQARGKPFVLMGVDLRERVDV